MASESGGVPTRAEVERELERILASKRLKLSRQRCLVLQYIVKKYLDQQEISEDIIGYDLVPGYEADNSNVVRVIVSQLRRTLSLYYAQEGAGDIIRIDLPPGAKYQPAFSYASPATRPYARGMRHFTAMSRRFDAEDAIEQFNKAIALDPAYAPAYAARAEAQLSRAPYASWPFTRDAVAEAEASARVALQLHSKHKAKAKADLWRPHVVLAMVHSCRCEWKEAEREFKAAHRASPDETERHVWYAAYLLATGEPEKAVRLISAKADDAPGDPAAQSVHALFLYVTRDFTRAEALLREVQSANHWLTHLVLACIRLQDAESDDAWIHLDRAYHLLGGQPFPGLEALCLECGTPSTKPLRESRAADLFSKIKEIAGTRALQLALCHMAFNEPEKAIACLRRARTVQDPLMIWVNRWPLLDPLRKQPGFRRLIRSIGFPEKR